ncbi:MAG TPA: 3-hydroxyacyl-ACP dehydratase FabZ [Gammaproteobacteria bacterium]|nr:3-hydroxyacyl-ACP dehydratase FabZ [Gammaproteobacteria bacterium]
MDIHDILERLPHRYPFLLVDRVVECVPDERLVALKSVTMNEPFFVGHFPIRPVMPGVLVLEAMVQTTSLLVRESHYDSDEGLHYLVGVDKASFRRPVEPGDQLRLTAVLDKVVRKIGRFQTRAEVDGRLVASAQLLCASR